MKKLLSVLALSVVMVGCNSTTNEQEQTASVNETQKGLQQLSDAELEALAKQTNFTAAELKAAANALGFKCSVTPKTGSRIKKKVCSSEQQRLARAEARRSFVERNRSFANEAPKLPIGR